MLASGFFHNESRSNCDDSAGQPGIWALERWPNLGREHSAVARESTLTGNDADLVCVDCGHKITADSQRISKQGGHFHLLSNPGGTTFQLGCFADARGCGLIGYATPKHTWFQGYAWRIGVCTNCFVHIGWVFENDADDAFYGLILTRLTSARG